MLDNVVVEDGVQLNVTQEEAEYGQYLGIIYPCDDCTEDMEMTFWHIDVEWLDAGNTMDDLETTLSAALGGAH